MSLHELLELNKIVFGVDLPKIWAYKSINVQNFSANLTNYELGYHINSNYENHFIFCPGSNQLSYIRRTGVSSFQLVRVNFNDYICLKDIFDRDVSLNYSVIGLSVCRIQPIAYKMSGQTTQIKDTDNKVVYTTTNYAIAYDSDNGIERFYVLEYDQTRLLK